MKQIKQLTFHGLLIILFIVNGCQNSVLEKGYACLDLGDYPLASQFFIRAVEENPEDYLARLGLGKALLQKATAEADSSAFAYALVQFEACRSLHPTEDLSSLLADVYTEKARICLNQNDTLSALSALAKATERAPHNVQPLNLAGIIYGKLGEVSKAKNLFAKVLQLDSNDASAHFNLGMILWQAGEFKPAHDHWLKALRAMPQNEDIIYWFAFAESKLRENP